MIRWSKKIRTVSHSICVVSKLSESTMCGGKVHSASLTVVQFSYLSHVLRSGTLVKKGNSMATWKLLTIKQNLAFDKAVPLTKLGNLFKSWPRRMSQMEGCVF